MLPPVHTNEIAPDEQKFEEWRVELLKWLIDRSDGVRHSYSNRASLILSADALVVATVAFVVEKAPAAHPHITLIKGLAAVSLAAMFASFVLAFKASLNFWRDSSRATRFPDHRLYFNARNSVTNRVFTDFHAMFIAAHPSELMHYGCAELWASYILQRQRYRSLKAANLTLLTAVASLITAIFLAFI